MSGVASALWEDRGARMGPLRLLASGLGIPPRSMMAPAVGGCIHLVVALVLAPLLYGLAFHAIGRAEAGVGLLLAAPHAAIAWLLLHGLARRRRIRDQDPGAATAAWSPLASLALLLSHLVYGVVLGYVYVAGG